MAKQIRDYLLGDFLELCIGARQVGRQHGAAFSDGGGSMIATHKHRKSGALVTYVREFADRVEFRKAQRRDARR